jgi:formylglycine-generating enzyme required for sulfatase activity
MHGNIYEWCEDEWHTSYTGAPADGSAWIDGTFSTRIIRGGSWDDIDDLCRSATRYGSPPGTQADTIGFRLVLDAN